MLIPSGEVRIKPTPLSWALAAPSTDNLQMGWSDVSWAVSVGSVEVNFMMKSAKIFPFDRCSWLVPNVELAQLYGPFHQSSRGFWFVQYLLHQVFCWNFDGVGLEVLLKSSGGGHQC